MSSGPSSAAEYRLTDSPVDTGRIVLAADVGQVQRVDPVNGVQLVTTTDTAHTAHTALLRAASGDPEALIPAGGGTVVAVAGAVAVSTASWTAPVEGTSEIVGVATVAVHRRRGLGALVVAAAVGAAARHGADLVWLRTGSAEARRLYASLGFEETPALATAPESGRE